MITLHMSRAILGCLYFLLVTVSAETPALIDLDKKSDATVKRLNKLVGKEVAVVGRSGNSKMGAGLYGNYQEIIVRDLERWPETLYRKRLSVTGTLSSKTYKSFIFFISDKIFHFNFSFQEATFPHPVIIKDLADIS